MRHVLNSWVFLSVGVMTAHSRDGRALRFEQLQTTLGHSTCGLEKSRPADCKEDMGSCGNACCALDIEVSKAPEALYADLKQILTSGADSHAYSYVPGTMPFKEHPPDDLRDFNIKHKFIVQGSHTTSGRKYVDTLNFNIRASSGSSSVLRAFSISNIHGALGDAGQNYMNLAFVLRALGADPSSATELHGCGKPTPQPALLQSQFNPQRPWIIWLCATCQLAHVL